MDLLITAADVYNSTGLDLGQCNLGMTPEQFMQRRQNEVLNYMARFCYFKMAGVELYAQRANLLEIITNAVIEQTYYVAVNGAELLAKQGVVLNEGRFNIADRWAMYRFAVSQTVHDMLEQGGLLYSGSNNILLLEINEDNL